MRRKNKEEKERSRVKKNWKRRRKKNWKRNWKRRRKRNWKRRRKRKWRNVLSEARGSPGVEEESGGGGARAVMQVESVSVESAEEQLRLLSMMIH